MNAAPRPPELAFYCVADAAFFPGAAALINSLRLVGHDEPVIVLDCGLEPHQRELLRGHATVVRDAVEGPPNIHKLIAPLANPARVMALVDADVVVTRPLTELVDAAAGGRLVAFENDHPRFFAQWAELLELEPVPAGPYLSTGTLVVDGELAARFMPVVADKQRMLERRGTWRGDGTESDPFHYLDQDILNPVVRLRLDPDEIVAVDSRLAPIPPFSGVRLRDERTLACEYADRARPYTLHHCSPKKPWLTPMRSSIYSRLLTRLLLSPDVPVRLEPEQLPLRLRTGIGPAAERARLDAMLAPSGILRRAREALRGRP